MSEMADRMVSTYLNMVNRTEGSENIKRKKTVYTDGKFRSFRRCCDGNI